MFLKRIELQGFKSFADKTVLLFDSQITGIVGPNGCGKSNVNDAIRWVLGEQSAKSLRGSNMSDVIFSGSAIRKPVNMAKVTLVFDNTARVFDIEFDEVAISRQLSRSGNEAGYFINQTPCRLKDIQDLVMDTGLGKDSLSIITQGNISSFADARPEERRLLFEEAAGVAKYKKRKKVSLSRLENTQANLDRLQDIIDELESRLAPLQAQAQKAKEFLSLKEALQEIEVSVLADEIENYQNRLTILEADIISGRLEESQGQEKVEALDASIQALRKEMYAMDGQISAAQEEFTRLGSSKLSLEKQKIELEQQRRYQMAMGDVKAKATQLSAMEQEASFEYEDRKRRLAMLKDQLHQQEQKASALRKEQMELAARQKSLQDQLQPLYSRQAFLEQNIAQPFGHQQALKALMQAKNALEGLEGVVASLLEAKEGMAQAIQSALSGSASNVVMADEKASRQAIYFLKKNKAGRATFMPMNVLRPRFLKPAQKTIAQNSEGFVGIAADLVTCDPRYNIVKESLLGNIVVCKSLEDANACARNLSYSAKIVSLDGDVVHAGGNMTGGSMKNQSSLLTWRQELAQLKERLARLEKDKPALEARSSQLEAGLSQCTEQITSLRIEAGKLENICQVKKDKLDSIRLQISQLSDKGVSSLHSSTEAGSLDLIKKLSAVQEQMDAKEARMLTLRQQRMQLGSRCEDEEDLQRQLRRTISAASQSVHKLEMESVQIKTRMEASLMRLNTDYQMTFEYALSQKKDMDFQAGKAKAAALRKQIKALGNVNLDAPQEYEEVSSRHGFLCSQKEELLQAAAQIKDSISQMDTIMIQQFSEMFEKINSQLDGVFKAMFGGGKARLAMLDPENVLETGIDIEVQPPGKTVKNLQAFSGGEKALIAISVLFAILKARTIPLCIFDEVEAALDQANVERFARYLSNFREESQFIVVTHRPGTMEQCDCLYGVTMENNGVSSVLKVQLKDAIHIQESEVGS